MLHNFVSNFLPLVKIPVEILSITENFSMNRDGNHRYISPYVLSYITNGHADFTNDYPNPMVTEDDDMFDSRLCPFVSRIVNAKHDNAYFKKLFLKMNNNNGRNLTTKEEKDLGELAALIGRQLE